MQANLLVRSFPQFVLENDSSFHHELYILQFPDVSEGLAAHCHKVRPFAGFDSSRGFTPAQQLSGNRGAGANGLHRGHAVLDIIFELLGLIYSLPVESARVRAKSFSICPQTGK